MLYSFGGVSANKITTQSYRFDGTTWQAIAPLPAPREYSNAVSDGTYIYLLGGLDAFGTRTTSLYRYDPQTDTYRTLRSFSVGRFAPGAVVTNGSIYLVGGIVNTLGMTSEVYTIATNTWTNISPYPLSVGFISLVARGDYLYGIGGVDGPNVATTKTYRYDPSVNAWNDAAVADLPDTRWGAANALYRDRLLMAGGYVGGSVAANISSTALIYSFATDEWTPIEPMQQARARMSGGSMGTGFYSIGGRSSSDTFMGTNSNQRYLGGCAFSVEPTATPTASATSPTPTATLTRTATVTPTHTSTPTHTAGPSPTPVGPERLYIPLVHR